MKAPYIGKNGLIAIADTLSGNENIYVGIRPRGIHAGNKIPVIIYPYLLCELMEMSGKQASFTINYFLNDYEQYTLDGPNKKKYPFNIVPLGKTLQYEKGENGLPHADYWSPIIKETVEKHLLPKFPHLKLSFVRNSEMRDESIFRDVIFKTIKNPEKLRNLFYKYSGKNVVVNPSIYCMAVCRKCEHPALYTKITDNGKVSYQCEQCGNNEVLKYSELHYWLYHKPLAIPRIKLFDIDLCITGSDHFDEGDYIIRQKLFDFFGIEYKPFKTLYCPILIGTDGKLKMSKSKNNYYDMEFDELLHLVKSANSNRIYGKK